MQEISSLSSSDRPKHLWVKSRDSLIRLEIENLIWIEAAEDYVRLHTLTDRHMLRTSLAALLERLVGWDFVRIHRSAAVRSNSIEVLRRTSAGNLVVLLTSGAEVPVGRRFGRSLRKVIAAIQ